MKISKRTLSKGEAVIFSKEITQTPNIVGYLPRELLKLSNVLVIENKTEIIGILAYVETKKFVDLKLMIIRGKFRGKGYGAKLFKNCTDLLADTKKPMYAVTKNPVVIHLLKQAGFVQVRFIQLPVPCMLHQLRMIFSLYRIKEFIKKSIQFPREAKFTYWLKD